MYSGYVKEIEDKPEATPWGKKMPFGQLMAEKSNGRGEKEDAKGTQGTGHPSLPSLLVLQTMQICAQSFSAVGFVMFPYTVYQLTHFSSLLLACTHTVYAHIQCMCTYTVCTHTLYVHTYLIDIALIVSLVPAMQRRTHG